MKFSGMSFCFESRASELTVTRNGTVISTEPQKIQAFRLSIVSDSLRTTTPFLS